MGHGPTGPRAHGPNGPTGPRAHGPNGPTGPRTTGPRLISAGCTARPRAHGPTGPGLAAHGPTGPRAHGPRAHGPRATGPRAHGPTGPGGRRQDLSPPRRRHSDEMVRFSKGLRKLDISAESRHPREMFCFSMSLGRQHGCLASAQDSGNTTSPLAGAARGRCVLAEAARNRPSPLGGRGDFLF